MLHSEKEALREREKNTFLITNMPERERERKGEREPEQRERAERFLNQDG